MSTCRWNAHGAVSRRPFDYEHAGISFDEAVQRILDLTYAAKNTGITHRVYEHMVQLAPCLTMCSPSESNVTVKIEVDTSDVERAKDELDLVSRKDVESMIAKAIAAYDRGLPLRMRAVAMARGM